MAQAQETVRARLKAGIEQRRDERAAPAGGDLQELRVQGRKVLVHLPAGYDASRPMPLVIAFHGGGGHAEHMADDGTYGLQRKADEAGFVVVFPNGTSKRPDGRFATWNAGGCCGDARDRGTDDVGFARTVVETLRDRYRIDPGRVFAVGMSNGGMLSHRLACEAADVFHAVASVAGVDETGHCTPARPVSVLHIHARNDDTVRFDGGRGDNRDESPARQFLSVPETVSRWARRNHCSAPAQLTLDKPGATCETHTGCTDGATVQLCVTDTGGHSWPGADSVRRGKEVASQALDANDVIWRFFESSSR